MQSKRLLSIVLFALLMLLVACDSNNSSSNSSNSDIPSNAIEISIVYAQESEQYMPEIIARFNQSYRDGINPVTGNPLANGERPIYVTGSPPQGGLSSGGVMQGIVNAALGANVQNTLRPTMFAPSVSHWLTLANIQSPRLFDLAEAEPTAISPVVIAIWESRLRAILQTIATRDGISLDDVEVGWRDLLDVLNSPNGWADYGITDGRRAVYYGHANPLDSSTALSTLIMEYYACAREQGFTERRLELEQVNDVNIQDCVRQIETLVRHYSNRTEDFLEYIGLGTSYLDFVAVEETDMVCMNMGGRQGDEQCLQPSEPLVALYPSEGTFWHEHPIAIVNADWVTPEQREASRVFIDYVLSEPSQQLIMTFGFRPANNNVQLGFPLIEQNGVDPNEPSTIIDIPSSDVLIALQESWSLVRKQADIWLLIDVSGSMRDDDKIQQVQQAALAFLDNIEPVNRVGLAIFNDDVQVLVPLDTLENNEPELRRSVETLRAQGGTALFGAVVEVLELIHEEEDTDRIRAVILLSDGANATESNTTTLQETTTAISAGYDDLNPVIVVPVAYGSDPDINALTSIARASSTRLVFGDPDNISSVLNIISSFF